MNIEEYDSFSSCGIGVYLGPSILDHSCVPNAYAVNLPNSSILEVRCIKEVEKFEDLRICYLAGALRFAEDRK